MTCQSQMPDRRKKSVRWYVFQRVTVRTAARLPTHLKSCACSSVVPRARCSASAFCASENFTTAPRRSRRPPPTPTTRTRTRRTTTTTATTTATTTRAAGCRSCASAGRSRRIESLHMRCFFLAPGKFVPRRLQCLRSGFAGVVAGVVTVFRLGFVRRGARRRPASAMGDRSSLRRPAPAARRRPEARRSDATARVAAAGGRGQDRRARLLRRDGQGRA